MEGIAQLDSTEAKDLRADVIATYDYAQDYWTLNYNDIMRKCWKIYKRVVDPNYLLDSKLFPPVVFANCNLVHSILIDSVFGSRDVISFIPGPDSDADHCRAMDNLIGSQFEKSDFFWGFWEFSQYMTILPYAIGKVIWNNDMNCPVFSALGPWEVYFDPHCGWNIQRAGYIHQTALKTVAQIKAKRDAGEYEITDDQITAVATDAARRKDNEISYYSKPYGTNDMVRQLEVIESHMGDKIITMIGGAFQSSVIARVIEKPLELYPYLKGSLFPEAGEAHGEGLVNPVKDLQLALMNFLNVITPIS